MLAGANRSRAAQLSANLADLVLNIEVPNFSLLDATRVDEGAVIGYAQGLPAIKQWAESGAENAFAWTL